MHHLPASAVWGGAQSRQPMLDRVPAHAAFFDLDKTVIARSSVLAFGRPFYQGGLITRRAVLRSSYAQFVFAVSGADEVQTERMRSQLTTLCTGWDVAQVAEIVAETVHELIDPIIYAEAAELIAAHHAAGRQVVIVSSSGAEVVEPIGALLGVDRVIATRMDIRDGRYTGQVEDYVHGTRKADAVRALAAEAAISLEESFAYSDSSTDVPMLETVGHPHAVNPDRALRRIATERGWPVLNFARPVPLRRRLPLRRGRRSAAAGQSVAMPPRRAPALRPVPPPTQPRAVSQALHRAVPAALGTAVGVSVVAGLTWYARQRWPDCKAGPIRDRLRIT